MNSPLPTIPGEVQHAGLLRELLAAEPRLAALMAHDEVEMHVRRFIRQLALSAERDALARKDVVT